MEKDIFSAGNAIKIGVKHFFTSVFVRPVAQQHCKNRGFSRFDKNPFGKIWVQQHEDCLMSGAVVTHDDGTTTHHSGVVKAAVSVGRTVCVKLSLVDGSRQEIESGRSVMLVDDQWIARYLGRVIA